MDSLSNYGERLKEFLLENKLSPKQFAAEINVGRSTVDKTLRIIFLAIFQY